MLNKTISGTLLIAGVAIGAGMLGIPLLTAKAGFLPAMGITTLVWLFMLATGFLYLEATLWMDPGANILSMSGRFLGRTGRLLSGGTFLFLYYCLMVAYYAAGSPIFSSLLQQGLGLALPGFWSYLIYGLVFGAIVALGMKVIDRINYVLTVAMFLSYASLIGVGMPIVSNERLIAQDWSHVVFAAPILFSAFGYHNIIPSLTTYFHRNVKLLRRSIFWGTFSAFLVYLVWQWLVIGAVPAAALDSALTSGQPATAALQTLTGSPWVMKTAQFFAFFAIITSMLGVAFSMVDFMADGLKLKAEGWTRILLCFGVFLPPFFFSILDPSIFVFAIGFAGGFGEAFLNGLLPVALVWVGRYKRDLGGHEQLPGKKGMLGVLFAFALAVMLFEVVFVLNGK